MSRNRSKIFDEIFLFFLFPHLPFSSHPREWTFVYILFFFSFGPKTFPIPPFQQWISPRLVKIFYLILIISGEKRELESFDESFIRDLASIVLRECAIGILHASITTSIHRRSCLKIHVTYSIPFLSIHVVTELLEILRSELSNCTTPLWTRFLYSYMGRNVSLYPSFSLSSCFLANSLLFLFQNSNFSG